MADNQNPNRESTFGRDLMKYISSRLPFQSISVEEKIEQLNPKYDLFYDKGSNREEALIRQSIASSISTTDDAYASILQNKDYHNFMYANIQPDKGLRWMYYRVMAAFAEVAEALDEICDEFINKDENAEIINIHFRESNLSEEQKRKIRKEFRKYVNYFDFKNNGWEYFRQLLVDAEIYF